MRLQMTRNPSMRIRRLTPDIWLCNALAYLENWASSMLATIMFISLRVQVLSARWMYVGLVAEDVDLPIWYLIWGSRHAVAPNNEAVCAVQGSRDMGRKAWGGTERIAVKLLFDSDSGAWLDHLPASLFEKQSLRQNLDLLLMQWQNSVLTREPVIA